MYRIIKTFTSIARATGAFATFASILLVGCVKLEKPSNLFDVNFNGMTRIERTGNDTWLLTWSPALSNNKTASPRYEIYAATYLDQTASLNPQQVVMAEDKTPFRVGDKIGSVDDAQQFELSKDALKPGGIYGLQVKAIIGSEYDSSNVVALFLEPSAPSLTLVSGDDQESLPGVQATEPIVVKLLLNGEPLVGKPVRFDLVSGPQNAAQFSETLVLTNASGEALTLFTPGSSPGISTVSASWQTLSVSAKITTVDPKGINLQLVSGDGQSAGPGASIAEPLTVKVCDEDGRPTIGASVRFTTIENNGKIDLNAVHADRKTGRDGLIRVGFAVGTVAGANKIRASTVGNAEAFVDFTATTLVAPDSPISLSKSSVTASVPTMLADGSSLATLTFTARDQYANVIPGAGAHVVFTPTLGTLQGNVTDHQDGTYTQPLRAPSTPGPGYLSASADINGDRLDHDGAKVILRSGTIDLGLSNITTEASAIVADGRSTTLITVTLKDDFGNALGIGGRTVKISTTRGVLVGSVIENGDGSYIQLIKSSTVAGIATLSVQVGGQSLVNTKTLAFISGPLDLATSTITANPVRLVPGSGASTTVTITARDKFGNSLTASQGAAVLTTSFGTWQSGSATTPAVDQINGTYTRTFTATATAGTATISGTIGGQALVKTGTVYITNNLSGPSPVFSTLQIVGANSKPADGGSSILVRVTLRDANNQLLAIGGESIAIESTAGSPQAALMDDLGNGIYEQRVVASSGSAIGIVTAKLSDGVSLNARANIYFYGEFDLTKSSLSASPSSILADGSSQTILTITAKDRNGTTIPTGGETSLAIQTSKGILLGSLADNANGTYSRILRSSNAEENAVVTATRSGILLTENISVSFYAPNNLAGVLINCANIATYKNKSIYVKNGTLTLDSQGITGNCPTEFVFDSVILTTNAVLTHSATTAAVEYGLEFTAGSVSVDNTSRIDVSGKGYPVATGSQFRVQGNNVVTLSGAGYGGSYGGTGGCNTCGTGGGKTYGSLFEPYDLGASGGSSGGAPGGGRIKITVNGNGNLTVDGVIKADSAWQGDYRGAGGSIWLSTPTLKGLGKISASAGGGDKGGSGGRIAIYYDEARDNFSLPTQIIGNVRACGNNQTPTMAAAAGTIYLKGTEQNYGDLVINNCNFSPNESNSTQINGPASIAPALGLGATTLTLVGAFADSYVTTRSPYKGFYINPNVHANSTPTLQDDQRFKIIAATADELTVESGDMTSIAPSPETDPFQLELVFDNLEITGNARLESQVPILVLNGDLSSGDNVSANIQGSVSSNVEFVGLSNLSVHSTFPITGSTNDEIISTVPTLQTILAGNLTVTGTAKLQTLNPIHVNGHVLIDGGMLIFGSDSPTIPDLEVSGDFTMVNGAVLQSKLTTTTKEYWAYASATNFSIDETSVIDANARGYSPGSGSLYVGYNLGQFPAAGHTISHGGSGGLSGPTTPTYGSFVWPTSKGSCKTAGNGGGAVHLQVVQDLTVNGTIRANGAPHYYGGCSGGSVLIETKSLQGSGAIQANGNTRINVGREGGGGGRVAIYYTTRSDGFSLAGIFSAVSAFGGASSGTSVTDTGAAGTIYIKRPDQLYGDLIINNGGYLATSKTLLPTASTGVSTMLAGGVFTTSSGFSNVFSEPNQLSGLYLNPKTNQNASLKLSDDRLFKITENNMSTLTVADDAYGDLLSVTDIAVGDPYKLVLQLDHLAVIGKGKLDVGTHSILVHSGDLQSGDDSIFELDGEIKAGTLDIMSADWLTTPNAVDNVTTKCGNGNSLPACN